MKYTKEIIGSATVDNISIAGVLRTLGLKLTGGNYVHVQYLIKKFNVDTSHFLGQSHQRGKSPVTKHTKDTFIKTYLIIRDNAIPISTDRIKKRLIEFGIKEKICEKCKNISWMGEEIPLELHHKNGNRWDNRIDNIELLCPNCHSQTQNNSGKKHS